jgi:hypothetical protein
LTANPDYGRLLETMEKGDNMILDKYTHGFVAQRFDTDKEEFVEQEFVAGHDCVWENAEGEPIDAPELKGSRPYLPFHMIQPKDFSKEKIADINEIVWTDGMDDAEKLKMIRHALETNC